MNWDKIWLVVTHILYAWLIAFAILVSIAAFYIGQWGFGLLTLVPIPLLFMVMWEGLE